VIALVLESKISNIYPPKSRTILNLRYGENPHQKVAKFEFENDFIKQLHGKELSYNNLLDIDAALKTILRFDKTTVAILKHTNPCGIAQDDDLTYAFKKAFDTDTVSPFGGITVTNETVDVGFAEHLNTIFTEIIIAPYFEEEALKELKKKKDRRIIRYERNLLPDLANYTQTQTCINGVLSQEPDLVPDDVKQWTFPTQLKPSPKDIKELLFAWKVVRILKSNAIALTSKRKTLGLGFGQTSRIDSLNIAIERAGRMKLDLNGSYCASDGFFPFSDSIERLAEIGVKCIVQPGGSKADQDVINACDRHKIAMAFTGKRHFRH
jgi:phosphoribosylaminoimidazolecarboxamide formyltransferase/IMP cyclohydrolase